MTDMVVAPFSRLNFDSETLPEATRFETYASGIANFDISKAPESPFHVRATAWRIGHLVLTRLSSSRIIYERTLSSIVAKPADHFYVNLHLRGQVTVESASGTVTGHDGSLLALDMRRPGRMDVEVRDEISLAIPRRQLTPRLGGLDPHGLIASGRLVPLLTQTATSVLAALPALDAVHGPTIEAMLIDLTSATLTDALRQRDMAHSENPALAERAIDWMESHLAAPFHVDRLCADLGVSRSNLYRALKGSGGALALLQRFRMRRFRALLEDPAETRSIATLSMECGFADKAHLTHSFKSAYGMTPGSFRQQATHDGVTDPRDPRRTASHKFADWVSGLT